MRLCLVFFWGFVGSIAVEIVNLTRAYNLGKIPRRYKRQPYWILRFLLAVVAGLVAIIFETEKPIQAFTIGVAAPLIIRRLEREAEYKE